MASTLNYCGQVKVRGTRMYVAAALAGAAMLSAGSAYVQAGTTYSWTTLAPGTTDWATASAWTPATGYPGSDGTTPTIDDIATFTHTGAAIGGVQIVNLTTPLPAGSIGGLTFSYADTSSTTGGNPGTSGLTLNVNTNLTFAATYNATTNTTGSNGTVNIIGGTTSTTTGKAGTTTVNIAQNVTFSTPGTVTLSGADSVGTALLNINGNYSAGTTQISNDGDNIRVNATAGTVNLGVLKVNRSSNNASITTANLTGLGGLHLYGGNVTASSFLVGANNSGGVVEEAGSNLTISGLFIVGDYASATNRYSNMFQTSGTVNAANSTLAIAGSTGGFNSQGNYSLTGGTLTVAGIQLNPVVAPSSGTDLANFLLGAGTMYVGSGGIAVGVGTATFTSTGGGTMAATASWTSPVAMKLSNITTVQTANASNSPFNITLSGALSDGSGGAGSLVKTGGGTLTLTGNNGYTGNTTVSGGRLVVSNTFANTTISGTGTGAVLVSNATLAGTGSILGDVTIGTGSHIAPGNNTVGTLGLGNLTLSSSSILDFNFNASANSLLNLTGALTIGGGDGINLYAEGTTNPFQTNGTYNLIQVNTVPANFNTLSVLNGVGGVTYTIGSTAHDITLTITGGTGSTGWKSDVSGSWGDVTKWNGGIPSGTIAILGNVLTTGRTVTLDGDRSITGLSLNSPFGYTIAQGSSGSLILDNGASTATINDFAGPHTISAPVILNSATSVNLTNPTDTVTVSGVISGAGNLSASGAGTLILANSANTYLGATINGGNLQIGSGAAIGSFGAGNVTNTGIVTFKSSTDMTIATTITGGGNITQAGTDVLTLSGVNTYSGSTNITSGIVRYGTTTGLSTGNINITSPGKLDLNGLSVSVAALTGTGTVDNMLAGSNSTLSFNGGSVTSNVTIVNSGGNLTISKGGSGSLTLSGNNSYSGGTTTTATSTSLIANSNNAFGVGTITLNGSQSFVQLGNVTVSNPIVNNDGAATEFLQVSAGAVATYSGNSSLASNSNQYRIGFSDTTASLTLTGTGNAGSATTILTRGNITYAGNASLTGTNSIILGRSAATSTLVLTIQDNAALHFNGILLAGNNSTSDAANSNVTLSGNGTLDAGTGIFNLNDSGSNGNATLTTNDNSTVRAGGFSMGGGHIGASGTFWLVNGGNIVATASNAAFMPASPKLTVALASTVNINDGGFNIGIAQPLIDFGGGGINKSGSGSLSLSGVNAYSGTTTVLAGALYADNATSPLGVGGSAVVNSGGTLGGNGTVTQAVSVGSGGHIAPGDGGTIGNLTLSGGLTLASGATLDFNFKPDGSANSLLTLSSGGITASGTIPIDLYQAGSTTPFGLNGTYDLIHFGGGFVPTTLSVADPVGTATYTFSNNGTDLFVTIAGGFVSTAWAVDSNGSWATPGNWTAGVPNGQGAFATFGSIITAPRTVSLNGNETVGAISFNNASAYTIAQGSGGSLIVDNGAANGSIASSNGSHFITAPAILNSSTNITVTNLADTLTVSGAISGAGNLSMGGLGTLVLSGGNSYAGTTAITGGTLQLATGGSFGAGNVTNTAAVVVNSSAPGTIANNISGNGTLTQSGAGTLVLSGTNSYTGATILNAGTTVQLGSATALGSGVVTFAGAATVDLHGNSVAVSTLTGTGTFDNQLAASNSTLTLTNATAATVSSSLVNTAGSLALIKNGAGTMTFTGTNSYSGGTTIGAGAISVTSNTTLGTGPIAVNSAVGLVLSNGVTLANNIVNGIPSTEFEDISAANGNATLSGTITSLAGDQYRLGVSGANATITLTGANSAQATSVLTRGNIIYAGNGSLAITATPSANYSLIVGRTSGATLNLTIQDNASVSSNNGISLDGNGSSSDATTTTVTLNGNGSLTSAALPLDLNDSTATGANVTLSLNGTSKVVTPGFISSHTTPVKVNLNGGSIVASASDPVSGTFFPSLTNVTATVQAGGVTLNDGGFAITIAQPLVDPTGTANGGLTKVGAGSVTLTGANTYSGTTTLTSGGLFVNNTTGSGTGPAAVILNGGTLGGTGTIAGTITGGTAAHTINPGSAAVSSIGTLKAGGLTTNSNTTLAFDLTTPAGVSDLLAVTGNVTLNGGKLAIASNTTGAASLGYYKVLSYTGTLTGSTGGIVLPAVVNNVEYTLDTTQDAGFIDIHRGFIGDATDDGKVDLNDLNTVLNNLGTTTSSWLRGNFDGAGTIDLNDLNDVLNNLGITIPSGSNSVAFAEALLAAAPASTPEPTSLGILALGAGALLARRRKA